MSLRRVGCVGRGAVRGQGGRRGSSQHVVSQTARCTQLDVGPTSFLHGFLIVTLFLCSVVQHAKGTVSVANQPKQMWSVQSVDHSSVLLLYRHGPSALSATPGDGKRLISSALLSPPATPATLKNRISLLPAAPGDDKRRPVQHT